MKITSIILGILIVLLTAFHFWFKAHAINMIEDLVETTSKGKVKLKIGKLHFNYFSKKIRLDDAVFFSTDTINENTAYRFSVEKIDLRAKAILPILFKKKMLIDSLALSNPQIEVVRLRAVDKPDRKIKKDVSIPEEMGKIYSSIQDALEVLKVKRFVIENGTFTLVNKIVPDQVPMKVSNLYFQIDNLQVDSSKLTAKDKILFSDNVIFTSHNQDILFPDGRHRLSFSHFRINLQKKLVEFDSCTIAATRTDSSNASFNVFFDGLNLTNIDFDTLYKSEVIKADSVYCINPRFNLEVDVVKKKDNAKPAPKLENIIQQLTGDLLLKYVVVTNADFNIKTVKDGRPTTFTFSKNNFEMQGLSIDQEAAKPVKVKSFTMAIRNYENFIKDSTYSIRFDSVILKDDRITLSNFIFHKLENGKILNTFSIPQFNLQGLSWDDLVFERRLKAEQAIMFNPQISYTARPKPGQQQNIFVSLGAVNEFMDLQFLDIRDGTIDLRLKNDLRIQLENANVAVQSNSLLTSTQLSGIKNSLANLKFKKGRVQAGDLLIELDELRYAGPNDRFEAASMHVKNDKNKMEISLKNVTANRMLVDEKSGSVFAEGLNWSKGDIVFNAATAESKKSDITAIIELLNVKGTNTTLKTNNGSTAVSATLNDLRFTTLRKRPGSKLILTGLMMDGDQLKVNNQELELSVGKYAVRDNNPSSFSNIVFRSNTRKAKTNITIPSLSLVPHVQPLLDGEFSIGQVDMHKPQFLIELGSKQTGETSSNKKTPVIDVKGLRMVQPNIRFTQARDSGMLVFNWQGEKNTANLFQAGQLYAGAGDYRFNDVQFSLSDFELIRAGKKTFRAGQSKISGDINSAGFSLDDAGEVEWDASIGKLYVKDLRFDSMGQAKGNLFVQNISLANLDISSSSILNLRDLAAGNKKFYLQQFTGNYSDAKKKLQWSNAGFLRDNDIVTADSLSVMPAISRDSFIAQQSFQKDYITASTGAIRIGPLDLDTYIKDNRLNIGSVMIDRFFFTDYKDKQLPFNTKTIKLLPVNLLQKIPVAMYIDSILLTNANVIYTETGEKTKKEGTIPVTRMNARLWKVMNTPPSIGDSLRIEASGYLMDTAWIRITVKESYTDSLGGFLMTAQARPADLRFLNPALLPLASVEIESGLLDTIYMQAVGREYLAWGEMQMYYRDLKVRILKQDEKRSKKFLSGLANLLIKNKNNSRTGEVFFIRLRDRSAINYLIKIAMSGISSSIGVKNNKKLIRRYKDEIEKSKSPSQDK